MSEASSLVSEYPSDPALELHRIVVEAAQPLAAGETVAAAIARAARLLGLTPARAKGLWYREARQITAQEADFLRLKRRQLQQRRIAQLEHELAALRALQEEVDAACRVAPGGPGKSSYERGRSRPAARDAARPGHHPGGQGLLALG